MAGEGGWRACQIPCRDRSLVTVSALIATGQVAQMPYHLNRTMDNGLAQAEAAEVISHLAYYVGWPNALGVAGRKRGHREARQMTYVTLRTPVETISPHFS
jgi:alkylhydroperoxidase/carboxymuconolactone decarboxylase family protein YurZ